MECGGPQLFLIFWGRAGELLSQPEGTSIAQIELGELDYITLKGKNYFFPFLVRKSILIDLWDPRGILNQNHGNFRQEISWFFFRKGTLSPEAGQPMEISFKKFPDWYRKIVSLESLQNNSIKFYCFLKYIFFHFLPKTLLCALLQCLSKVLGCLNFFLHTWHWNK